MLGITIGDVSGIGPEIVLKALASPLLRAKRGNLLIIGNRKLLEDLKQKFVGRGFSLAKYYIIDAFDDSLFAEDKPRRYKNRSVGVYPQQIAYGEPQKQCGISSSLQLHLASYLLKIGKIKGIVTAPVSKTALSMAGFPFPGQTEYFAAEFGVKKYGMLALKLNEAHTSGPAWSKDLKIILVTIHKPLKDVPKLITEQNVLEKIKLLNDYLVRYEKKRKPKIGVLALNPHAFEFTCGAEDKILKAIKQARKLGISVEGPIPADSAFSNLGILESSNLRIPYDGFVAMYHDQGMLPVKLLSKGGGVNTTLGLPFIRTSPLHGVAFDIAGKGIANPSSMINAIQLCQKLTETKY